MERHPDTDPVDGAEILSGERALRVDCRREGRGRRRERRAKRIAYRLEDVAPARFDCRSHDCIVTQYRVLHGGPIAVPAYGAAFDVAENKRQRTGW